jgi:hypothetical protein
MDERRAKRAVIGYRFAVIGRHAGSITPSHFLLANVNRKP